MIRALWASGDLSQARIGKMFGVGQSCVSNVITRASHGSVA